MATSSISGAHCNRCGSTAFRRRPPARRSCGPRPGGWRGLRSTRPIRDRTDWRDRGGHDRLLIRHRYGSDARSRGVRRGGIAHPGAARGRCAPAGRNSRRNGLTRRHGRDRHLASIRLPGSAWGRLRRCVALRQMRRLGIALIQGDGEETDDRDAEEDAGHCLAIHDVWVDSCSHVVLSRKATSSGSAMKDGNLRRSARFPGGMTSAPAG